MKKTLRSILFIALWMVLCSVPSIVNAEEENPIELTQDNYKSYLKDSGKYDKFYLPSGSYILMGDITLDDTLLIGYDQQYYNNGFTGLAVTLDLNGYVLRQGNVQELIPVIQVYQGSSLTIQDSRPEVTHKFTADSTGLWKLNEANGDKTVNGGVITGSVKTGLVLQAMNSSYPNVIAQCTMNGGNIVGCTYNSYGGGVNVGDKAEFTMNGGSIRGCTVTDSQYGHGGGVYVVGGTFMMNGGTISDCVSATKDGGDALYMTYARMDENSSFSMSAEARINGSYKDANPGASEGSSGLYTVTFDSDGGSEVPLQVRPQGAAAVKPDNPVKEGYGFAGWYIGEDAYDFSKSATTNLTLTAKWTQHVHCICGGETNIGDHTAHMDLAWLPWTATDKLPDKAGNYYLVDNVTLPTGTVNHLPDGVNLCLNGKSVRGEDNGTKLTSKSVITITDCNHKGSIGNMEQLGDNIKLVLYNSRIVSGTFKGEIVCNSEIQDGIFHGNVENNGMITGGIFYGTVNGTGTIADSAKVTVNFDSNGGSETAAQKILRGQKVTAPAVPAKTGYLFGGWALGGIAYNFTAPVIDKITLTAVWTLCDHSASTAKPTCTEQAICTACGAKYGENDMNNHSSLKKVDGVLATAASTGIREHWYCSACKKSFADADAKNEITSADIILGKLTPSIIEGMNGMWNEDLGGGLAFKSDAAYADFIEVLVDNAVIASDKYTVHEGSIIVELKKGYLATLTEGEHTLTIRSASGDAVTKFTIQLADSDDDSESTGSETFLSPQTGMTGVSDRVLFAAAVFSAICMAVLMVVSHREKQHKMD